MSTELKEKMRAELTAARDIAAKADAENRDLTPEEVTDASTHLKAYEGYKDAFQKANAGADLKKQLKEIGAGLGLEENDPDRPGASSFLTPTPAKSLGALFVESMQYVTFMKQHGNRAPGDRAHIQSEPVGVKSLRRKALATGASDTSGGAFVATDVTGIYEALGRPALTIRDLITVRQTGSDTVEFVRQTTQPTSADVVPEATSSADPTAPAGTGGGPLVRNAGGGYKPEGSIAFEKVTATVKTIAEWIPATKRGLADAAQLRGLIDDELLADLAQTEEDEILNGDGTGEHFTGILETANTQTQAYSATVAGLDPLLETTLKGRTKVKTIGRAVPTGYVFNPLDWEKIQLARLAKNPQNEGITNGIPTLHGLPVVESESIAAGLGLVADFRKAVLWDREQAQVSITDSHADFFIRNLVAVLAEERAAFGVTRPKAFVELDLTA